MQSLIAAWSAVKTLFFLSWWLHREFASFLVEAMPVVGFLPPLTPLHSVVQTLSQLLEPVWANICMFGAHGGINVELLGDSGLDRRFMCFYNYSYNYLGRRGSYPRFKTLSARLYYALGLMDERVSLNWNLFYFQGNRDVLIAAGWLCNLLWDLVVFFTPKSYFELLFPQLNLFELYALYRRHTFTLEFCVLHPAALQINNLVDSCLLW